ncbi:MAG: sensor histidine kinase [Cytophagaceae bacterium]
MQREFLSFKYFKPYVSFLLENHTDEFVKADIERARVLDVPLLKILAHLSEEELFLFSKKGTVELFEQIMNGDAVDQIILKNQEWKDDKIPGIPRDKVDAIDIPLVNNVKKHSFLTFLTNYTQDPEHIIALLREIEDFYTFQETLSIVTFTEINREEVTKREEHLKEAQAISHMGSWEFDLVKNKIAWSDELFRIFGYQPGEVEISYELYQSHLHPDERELMLSHVNACLQHQTPYLLRHKIIRKDGSIRWIEGGGKAVVVEEGKVLKISGIGLDITDVKSAEDKIKKSETLLLETQEIAGVGSYDWHIKDDKSVVTPEVAKIFGYTEGETYDFSEFEQYLHPDDRERVEEALQHSFKTGDPYLCEYRIFRKSDNILRHIWTKGKVFYDIEGKPIRISGSIMDITDRKNIEEALKQRKALLEASNKELEAFCYTISHDLRSPLRAIDGFGRKLANQYQDYLDDEGRRLLGIVRNNAQKMGSMIDSLLEFSRLNRKEINHKHVSMEEIVGKVINECNEQFPDHKALIKVETLPDAPADREMLHQVWHNLISNAIKFSSKTAGPIIEIGSVKENGRVVYYVKDNGAGFEMEYKDKLFGVFQRLHSEEEFSGSGVGLATVQRIVHRHGGTVWAEGKPWNGATFYFTLPVKKEIKQK